MVVEAAILDGEHRLHHARRNRGQRDAPPLLTARADERGEQRRVERDARHRRAVHLDARHAEHGAGRAAGRGAGLGCWKLTRTSRPWRCRPGQQHDGAAADGELAGLLARARAARTQIVEPVDELVIAEGLALVQLEGPRVDARQHAIALAVQSCVNLPAEGHPPVTEHADGRHSAEQG
jgi:hypothetical protein